MQRSWVSNKDRAVAIVAVVLVHVGVLAALLTLGAGPSALLPDKNPLEIFDVILPPPPQPPRKRHGREVGE